MQAIKDQIETKVLECITIAEQISGETIPMPPINFNLKGRCAGQYCNTFVRYTGMSIDEHLKFNMEIAVQNSQDFINRTVPHEVAHLVAQRLYGRGVNHDHRWQNIMTQYFNTDPSRCHNYDMTNVTVKRQRRFEYGCGCRTFQITTVRHNKILRGRVYNCGSCREPIKKVA